MCAAVCIPPKTFPTNLLVILSREWKTHLHLARRMQSYILCNTRDTVCGLLLFISDRLATDGPVNAALQFLSIFSRRGSRVLHRK